MKNTAYSINNIPIRLTDERWNHIVENHNDMAGYYYEVLDTISGPAYVLEGDKDELWAISYLSVQKVFLVIYKESKEKKDGFIITAFITTKIKKLLKRRILWQQEQQL
jgi:hypothetical protein